MPIAKPVDVETSLMRPLTDIESDYVQALLSRAETLLKTRVPDLLEKCTRNSTFSDLVVHVESESVARVFRAENNGIYRSETEDGYSYQLNMMVASGLLDILPVEWERLLGGQLRSVAPAADGYARARFASYRPDLRFQYGWPGTGYCAERW